MTLFGVQAALVLVTPERFLYVNILSFLSIAPYTIDGKI